MNTFIPQYWHAPQIWHAQKLSVRALMEAVHAEEHTTCSEELLLESKWS